MTLHGPQLNLAANTKALRPRKSSSVQSESFLASAQGALAFGRGSREAADELEYRACIIRGYLKPTSNEPWWPAVRFLSFFGF